MGLVAGDLQVRKNDDIIVHAKTPLLPWQSKYFHLQDRKLIFTSYASVYYEFISRT